MIFVIGNNMTYSWHTPEDTMLWAMRVCGQRGTKSCVPVSCWGLKCAERKPSASRVHVIDHGAGVRALLLLLVLEPLLEALQRDITATCDAEPSGLSGRYPVIMKIK